MKHRYTYTCAHPSSLAKHNQDSTYEYQGRNNRAEGNVDDIVGGGGWHKSGGIKDLTDQLGAVESDIHFMRAQKFP